MTDLVKSTISDSVFSTIWKRSVIIGSVIFCSMAEINVVREIEEREEYEAFDLITKRFKRKNSRWYLGQSPSNPILLMNRRGHGFRIDKCEIPEDVRSKYLAFRSASICVVAEEGELAIRYLYPTRTSSEEPERNSGEKFCSENNV